MQHALSHYAPIDIIMEVFENSSHKEKIIQLMEQLNYSYKQIDKDNLHFWK